MSTDYVESVPKEQYRPGIGINIVAAIICGIYGLAYICALVIYPFRQEWRKKRPRKRIAP